MQRNDAKFKELVSRLQSGELNRQQASEAYGVNYGTLCVWLSRSKLGSTTLQREADGSRKLHGIAAKNSQLDPDKDRALDAAVARVLAGEISALAASKESEGLSPSTIAARVRKAKLQAGIPIPRRRAKKVTAKAAADALDAVQ